MVSEMETNAAPVMRRNGASRAATGHSTMKIYLLVLLVGVIAVMASMSDRPWVPFRQG